jgi:hypothetical protein
MSEHIPERTARDAEDARLVPPPDERNPALIDAEHAYVITLIGAALFIGAVFIFVL